MDDIKNELNYILQDVQNLLTKSDKATVPVYHEAYVLRELISARNKIREAEFVLSGGTLNDDDQ